MNTTLIFPIALIGMNCGASIFYFINGDVARGFYWIAALMINISVLFIK